MRSCTRSCKSQWTSWRDPCPLRTRSVHSCPTTQNLFEDFCIVTESVRQGIPVNVTLSTEAPARRLAESA